MTPERWQQIRALYHAACDVPTDCRQSWLLEACPDPELRAELESLLAASANEPTQLQVDTLAAPEAAASPPRDELCGRMLGEFRVIQLIGSGGMGAVYLAERADGSFEQQVAIKLVRRGLPGEAAERRFLRERQILGRLNHRHICGILGGGISDDGRPYLVMPFLEGALPLDDYCERHRCDLQQRLTMFGAVCAAVQHAHQNLVVHSDLKPANILVTPDGQVQLVDFGIARLLDQQGDGATTLAEGGRPLTPQYASPEQIEGASPSTLSDVYSLGVVLYRLLTGTLPYAVENTTLRDLAELMARTDPAPPSRRSSAIAADLDNIVLKAMAREPERRYVSAAALAEDVQRWLDGRPVLARPATLGYQLGKFVRRHRWPVVTASLALLALGALATVLALSNAQIAAQARQLQLERDRAEATADFWASLFEQTDPIRAQQAATSITELLDRARQRLAVEGELSRPIRSRLLAVISTAYWNLAEREGALAAAEQAVALQQPDDPPSESAVLAYKQLANIAMVLDRLEQGRAAAEQALRLIEALPEASPVLNAQVLDALALVLDEQGQTERAAELLEQVVAIQRQLPLEQIRIDMATALGSLGYMHYRLATRSKPADQPRLDRAEALVDEALMLLRTAFGEEHPRVGFMLNAQGVLRRERGDYAGAADAFAAASRIAAQGLPDGHEMRVSLALNEAAMWLAQAQWARAEQAYAQALGAAATSLPAGHPDRIQQQLGLARSALGGGHLQRARAALSALQAELPQTEAELPEAQLWARALHWRLVDVPPADAQAEIRSAASGLGDPALLQLLAQLPGDDG